MCFRASQGGCRDAPWPFCSWVRVAQTRCAGLSLCFGAAHPARYSRAAFAAGTEQRPHFWSGANQENYPLGSCNSCLNVKKKIDQLNKTSSSFCCGEKKILLHQNFLNPSSGRVNPPRIVMWESPGLLLTRDRDLWQWFPSFHGILQFRGALCLPSCQVLLADLGSCCTNVKVLQHHPRVSFAFLLRALSDRWNNWKQHISWPFRPPSELC